MAIDGELTGFVHVLVDEPASGGMLENARVKQIGGRSFIVGELIRMKDGDSSRDAREGMTFWFPVDQVLMMTELPDYETARRLQSEGSELGSSGGWKR